MENCRDERLSKFKEREIRDLLKLRNSVRGDSVSGTSDLMVSVLNLNDINNDIKEEIFELREELDMLEKTEGEGRSAFRYREYLSTARSDLRFDKKRIASARLKLNEALEKGGTDRPGVIEVLVRGVKNLVGSVDPYTKVLRADEGKELSVEALMLYLSRLNDIRDGEVKEISRLGEELEVLEKIEERERTTCQCQKDIAHAEERLKVYREKLACAKLKLNTALGRSGA